MAKLEDMFVELQDLNNKISIMQRVNTCLPKKKAKKIDEIIDPLITRRTMLQFNFRQKLMKKKNA